MIENKSNNNTICPLPWLHFSAHLDSTMRICCNTDHMGFVYDNNGKTIKLSEVKSIEDYFNLDFFKKIRREMIEGEKPEICRKCYQVEDAGGQSVRQGYLSHYLNKNYFPLIIKNTEKDGSICPKVKSLDFSLSNNCNLKCIMCSPDASYPIKQDFDKLGVNYDLLFTEGAHKNWKNLDALDRLIPEISNDLGEFLTTGGEPFLSKPHLHTVDLLIKGGRAENMTLSYHTNCTVKNEELFDKWNQFKGVTVHFSIDAYGHVDEYIRHKTKWKTVEENVNLMLEHRKVFGEVHTCVQVCNIFALDRLYSWMEGFKGRMPILPIHIWMHNPAWLHINILPQELKEKALEKLEKYFAGVKIKDFQYEVRSKQVLSFLTRSLEESHDEENLEVFKERIKKFETLRKQPAIEKIVPELKPIFKNKKKFIFF